MKKILKITLVMSMYFLTKDSKAQAPMYQTGFAVVTCLGNNCQVTCNPLIQLCYKLDGNHITVYHFSGDIHGWVPVSYTELPEPIEPVEFFKLSETD